jgi:hypothetical protein
MYKPFTYLVITYFPTSVEVHPQLSNNGPHPVDGAPCWVLVHCGRMDGIL